MHLEAILLALLSRPASGYDLKRAFDTTINYFWHADIAQVYRSLQRMETKGLLKCKEQPSEQGPPRKVYRRTAAGKKQLFSWLRQDPDNSPERRTSVAQLVFMGQLGDLDQTRKFLFQMRDQLTSRLAVLKHIQAAEPESAVNAMTDEDFHGFLGLQMGMDTLAARIKSIDGAIALTEKRISSAKEADRS